MGGILLAAGMIFALLAGVVLFFYPAGKNDGKKVLLGSAMVLTAFFVLIFIVPGMLLDPDGEGNRPSCACTSNLKQIGLALKQYAMDNDGKFPHLGGDAGLDMLREQNYLTDYKLYGCPSTTDTGKNSDGTVNSSYIYRGGLTEDDSPDSALAWDKPDNHENYGNILFLDGHVTGYEGRKWQENIDKVERKK